jgi:class 3 adenylate cyclase
MPIERKLAAIMFTDIAGYTAKMSEDESATIQLLTKKESILKPLINEHNGTYVKSTGDGSLSHFNSAVDASMCAKKLQQAIYDDNDLNVRIGVHLGDTTYLETAYKQLQENASAMDDGNKYLSYPIPKAILEAWKTLNKDNN